jgi:hypothetical protein
MGEKASVEVERDKLAECGERSEHRRHRFALGLVGGLGLRAEDQRHIDHRRDVAFVAVEGLCAALSAMAHVRVSG